MQNWYTPHPFNCKRFPSKKVIVGNLTLGHDFPVRTQSMVNTTTCEVQKSVKQAIEIFDAGGELVRYTVINTKDAEALGEIKAQLVSEGYKQPIVADVHFNANLADIAARHVDKVRINPGNYLDKRATFKKINFTDEEYQLELNRIEDRFKKLIDGCKAHGTALRIGTNHGSLSDRIMSRYGDTPEGMVEATMEFVRLCKKHHFNNVLISLKSSNTRVMVQAYRLMAKHLLAENLLYGLHLGVTEAGSGEEGRIKSAVGIGALMHDGLGDTIRVSLTEHPAKEIPVANALVEHFKHLNKQDEVSIKESICFNPYTFKKRPAKGFGIVGGQNPPVVVADLSGEPEITLPLIESLGFVLNPNTQLLEKGDLSPDVIYTGEHFFPFKTPDNVQIVIDHNYWDERSTASPLFSWEEYRICEKKSRSQNWVQIEKKNLDNEAIEQIKTDETLVLVNFSYKKNQTAEQRVFANIMLKHEINCPLIALRSYSEIDSGLFQIKSAADTGILFIDGLFDGLWLKNTFKPSHRLLIETSFNVLQASRSRISKTEYISCPSCGRTLFNLEETVQKVKQATAHLKGLKIAIMGCIVNGPGEMADADYGYVGAGPGKVSLYKGKTLVKKNVDAKNAVQELLNIIE